ncbi:hypothetical protein [Candidatus Absconditicoccus praedator]|uniref:hypothetical protein n=1 Tax=Candidatus Absconditicoccus praedator TaxID=2735562 RepID=UPI001E63949F|nr:hypothetical protein [Candidatus Absconditicoccus praedator]UFX83236.1 hypothetical protein HLG78_03855 [Candidatus Absconditicoccus praedator]
MKKIKLSDLFSSQNYFVPKGGEQLKNKINNKLFYQKSLIGRFGYYSKVVVPVFLVFVFGFVFLNFLIQDAQEDDTGETKEGARMMHIQEDEPDSQPQDDMGAMQVEQEQPEAGHDETADMMVLDEEVSDEVSKETWYDYAYAHVTENLQKGFTQKRIVFAVLVFINILLVVYFLKILEERKWYWYLLLILGFLIDLFVFYWIIFIWF